MAFKLHSFIEETFITEGTGAITLGGASGPRRKTFASELSNGDTCFYAAEGGSHYEEGLGTYSAGALTRTAVFKSSNSNNAVNWPAGTKTIRIAPLGISDLSATGLASYKDLLNVGLIGRQVFTGNGTYTPTSGMRHCIVEAVGGGGGGGGGDSNTTSQSSSGGGGAGGTYSLKRFSAADIGASKAVVIGAAGTAGSAGNNSGGTGGTTTFGSTLLTAPGGGGGGSSANNANLIMTSGGTPGAAGTGDVSIPGQPGTPPWGTGTSSRGPGMGGNSVLGHGAASNVSNTASSAGAGSAGGNYGGGGSGGRGGTTGGTAAGGAGGAGVLIVWEFG